jgi:replicative DNA helicase
LDIELAVLSRAVQVRGIDQLVAAGIKPEHFHDLELREVYVRLSEHYTTWKKSPPPEVIDRIVPNFKVMPVQAELEYLISEFGVDSSIKAATTKWRDIGNLIDKAEEGDAEARRNLVQSFMEHSRELAALVPTSSASRYSQMAERLATIRSQQEEGVLPGVRIGIPQLDPVIHVIRKSEVVVHAGYSGRGKTTGLIRSLAQAYSEGDHCLMLSLEMEGDEVWEVFDAHAASLSRKAMRRRELSVDDYDIYMRAAERVANAKNDIVVYDDTDGSPTVDKLAALIERWRPDTVGVDYLSLMAAHTKVGADWERVTLISHALKQMARSSKIRLYVAAQNSKDAADNGPTEDNIAFSTSIFQDCNVMVGYHQDKVMERANKMQVRLIKNRAGDKGPLGDSGYGEIYEMWDRDRMIFEDWKSKHDWLLKS